jgi:hypothetical protein
VCDEREDQYDGKRKKRGRKRKKRRVVHTQSLEEEE